MRTTFRISACLAIAVSVGLVVGCGEKKGTKDGKQQTNIGKTDDDHHHEGPHGGHVIDLGNGAYHAELTHDDATKSVAIYLLDANLKKPVTTAEKEITINLTVDGKPQQYTLPAAPQADDPEGQSSRFELKDDKLVDAWDAPKSTGRVTVNIGGKPYTGDIDAHEHDHDHEKK